MPVSQFQNTLSEMNVYSSVSAKPALSFLEVLHSVVLLFLFKLSILRKVGVYLLIVLGNDTSIF